jgi:phosphatidylglycerophosphate synthase
MANFGLNRSLLADGERVLLDFLVKRLPHWIAPNHLTTLGLAGAVVTGTGFVLCNLSPLFLIVAIIGILLNWFGDSLDGSLARFRQIDRPRYGFLLDHSNALIAQSIIILGLGCSPYFTLSSALFALSLYLLLSSYTYLRVAVEGVHRLSYGGMGATEFRILVALWPLFVLFTGSVVVTGRIGNYIGLDVVIGGLALVTYVFFIHQVRNDLMRIDAEEKKSDEKQQ